MDRQQIEQPQRTPIVVEANPTRLKKRHSFAIYIPIITHVISVYPCPSPSTHQSKVGSRYKHMQCQSSNEKKNAVVPVVVTTQPIKSIVTLQKHPPINHHLLGALLLPPLRLS